MVGRPPLWFQSRQPRPHLWVPRPPRSSDGFKPETEVHIPYEGPSVNTSDAGFLYSPFYAAYNVVGHESEFNDVVSAGEIVVTTRSRPADQRHSSDVPVHIFENLARQVTLKPAILFGGIQLVPNAKATVGCLPLLFGWWIFALKTLHEVPQERSRFRSCVHPSTIIRNESAV